MDPNQETENSEYFFELSDEETIDESGSVDDFIKELEAKEKDLHITADTTFIEIAADFEDLEPPDFLKPGLAENGRMAVAPAVAETVLADRMTLVKLEREVVQLKNKISTMKTERTELLEKSLRRSRDFDAYKGRTERERGDTFQKQLSNLATQMLPALDNLDRALKFASDLPDGQRKQFVQFFDGIILVNQQVNEVLAGMGIMPIATVGEPFDPHFHEAVAIEETADFPPNTVSGELLRGFRIGDMVIRHSMVRVSQSLQEKETPEENETPEETEAAPKNETPQEKVTPQENEMPEDDEADGFEEMLSSDELENPESIDPVEGSEPDSTAESSDDE